MARPAASCRADARRLRARLSDEACDDLMREFLRVYEANWRLFDDVIPALDALRHRPLGIITNGLERQQRQKIETLGILDRFAVIVTSDGAKTPKPDPSIFRHAADAIGASPEMCVHVGDDWKKDVEGGLAAPQRTGVARIGSLLNLVGRA